MILAQAARRVRALLCAAFAVALPLSAAAQSQLDARQIKINGSPLTSVLPAGQGVAQATNYASMQAAASAALVVQADPAASKSTAIPGARSWNINDPTAYQGSMQAAGQIIVDRRYGQETKAIWDPGTDGNEANLRFGFDEIGNFTRPNPAGNAYTKLLMANAAAGGYNSSTFKTTFGALFLVGNMAAQGQHILLDPEVACYGAGDCIANGAGAVDLGGNNAQNDEGLEPININGAGSIWVYKNTVAATAPGASTLSLGTPTQEAGTQGDGRFLQDDSQADPCGASLSVTTIAGSGPTTMTLSGSGCAASTANTTSTTAVTVQNQPAPTSVNLAVSNSANFTTGAACVADQLSYETAAVTAIPDSTHLTIALRKSHGNNAIVAQGGACGKVVVLAADTWNAATQLSYYSVPNPVPHALPVIYSDATHLYVWIDIDAAWDSYVGQAKMAGGTNAFELAPAAEVLDVTNGTGHPSNVFSLAANAVNWTASDVVTLTPYPFLGARLGQWSISKTYPSQGAAGGGSVIGYYGIWNNNDAALNLVNHTPSGFYLNYGGLLTPPYGLVLDGVYNYPIRIKAWAPHGLISMQYQSAQDRVNFLEEESSPSSDYIYYSMGQKTWSMSFNGGAEALPLPKIGAAVVGALGGSSLAAGKCTGTFTTIGSTGDLSATSTFMASTYPYIGDAFEASAVWNGGNSVFVRVCNRSTSAATPPAQTYSIKAIY